MFEDSICRHFFLLCSLVSHLVSISSCLLSLFCYHAALAVDGAARKTMCTLLSAQCPALYRLLSLIQLDTYSVPTWNTVPTPTVADISDNVQHFPSQLSDVGTLIYTLVCHRNQPPPKLSFCVHARTHISSTAKLSLITFVSTGPPRPPLMLYLA